MAPMGILSLFGPGRPLVAVVPMQGAVGMRGRLGGRGFDDQSLAPQLEAAFAASGLKAVALAINCPGGSPVQSSLIGARIRRLADEKKVPVFAFCADVAASGGYWLACAADEIWADGCSILGSIGVVSAGFGFTEAIGKLGVERRVHTAGKSKSLLDPFQPEKPEDLERLHRIQEGIHSRFIDWVKSRRGSKLPEGADLFTGEIWLGEEAQSLGLADGIGHLKPVLMEKFGEKTRFKVFGPRRSFWERMGAPGVESLGDELTTRGLYARYGL